MFAATEATDGDCTMPPKLMWPVSPPRPYKTHFLLLLKRSESHLIDIVERDAYRGIL